VKVFTTKTGADFAPIPAHQLDILQRMHVSVALADSIYSAETPDLIIDGVIGYSLKGAPRATAGDLIRWANDQDSPILSLDAPSGVDTTTGTVFDPAIKATATMTLALPKEGLRALGVDDQLGELYLADISVPPDLYAEPALAVEVGHIFAQCDIIRLR
jgi:NAD(P)H-hydrate epimerase